MTQRHRKVLILGGGTMQLPAIRAARGLGLQVIVADGNEAAPGKHLADEFLHIDLKDVEQLAEAAREIRSRDGLDAVFTAGTDFSASVSYVAECLELPCTPYERALDATDKFRMRERLRAAEVRIPDFAVVTRDELSDGLPDRVLQLGLPCVVKPADSMGARGVVRANRWEDVQRYVEIAAAYSRTGRTVVEGYIAGPEFSLDAIVYRDEIQITGFADRHISFAPFFIEMGHTIPTTLPASAQERVIDEFKKGIRALDLGPGAAKGDMKLSPDGPVVGEIANRLSGGYMSGWTYPYSSGVNLSEVGLRVALGEAPGHVVPSLSKTSCERAVISIPGVLCSIEVPEDVDSVKSVRELFLTRRPGDTVRFPQNNVEKIGNVIAVDDDRETSINAAEITVARIVVRLNVDCEATDEFLFAPTTLETRHHAYPGAAEALFGSEMERDDRELWWRLKSDRAGALGRISLTLPLSLARTPERDWAHRTFDQTARMLAERVAVKIDWSTGEAHEVLERLFLRATLRGGLQGSLYVMQSLQND